MSLGTSSGRQLFGLDLLTFFSFNIFLRKFLVKLLLSRRYVAFLYFSSTSVGEGGSTDPPDNKTDITLKSLFCLG